MANNTAELKKFAQAARRQLREQVASRLEQVLGTDSAELRQQTDAIHELRQQIVESSKKAVIDRVAYTWFNRFCALRFMDVNRYNRIGVVSPAEGYTLPEILQEAKQGYIDDDLANLVNRPVVFDLLSGKAPSRDPQQEAYRLLLVGMCNALSKTMPFLFETINDYTELLMPPDLLSENSILHELRKVMTPEACQDVEIIGWLYQYYISERKDEVFEALKQNQKIEAEDIPAATQLFTPHWIVRYLVENSLGRLWMLNHPNSILAEKMDYYIRPVQEETDFLRIHSPEEIKICDPACGSGHMLTYAFDLLYAMYEEEGYPAVEIPGLILEKNLYGIEIDERAGTLAAFALVMKARVMDRRFFTRPVHPNICVLENIRFTDQELNEYMNAVGLDLFTESLRETLNQFEQTKNFGALIRPRLTDVNYVLQTLSESRVETNLFLFNIHEKVKKILRQAEFLSPRYSIVIANPPYMGSAGMNNELRDLANRTFPLSKLDLFAMFLERGFELLKTRNGYLAMITMESWMFLSAYEKLRRRIIADSTILSAIHMPYLGKGSTSMGINFGTIAAILVKNKIPHFPSFFMCLRYFEADENGVPKNFPIENDRLSIIFVEDLEKIPGYPLAYWVSQTLLNSYSPTLLESITISDGQNVTGNNDRFVREFWEVNRMSIGIEKKWFYYAMGGPFRRWYGNITNVIDWSPQTRDHFHKDKISRIIPERLWYKEGITWGLITSAVSSFRLLPNDATFDKAGSSIFFSKDIDILRILGFLNSNYVKTLLAITNPTLSLQVKNIRDLPLRNIDEIEELEKKVKLLIEISRLDWNSFEISYDFSKNPVLSEFDHSGLFSKAYISLTSFWAKKIREAKLLEERINEIININYGVSNEITSKLLDSDISLKMNPRYRYGNNRSNDENEKFLLTDTANEFISYGIGCIFGRYSLDKPCLILANQGETLQDYLKQVPEPTFFPDEDNVIPILDGEWFIDDITERFKKFLRVTFGDEHYEENLAFIEEAIGRDIRSYFVKDFYAYHVKMYQKRPIYWLFSSPKGSFNVLIYMHRYNRDTLSVILNKYLRPFQSKLEARKSYLEQLSISGSASPREKTAALKEIEKLTVTLEELRVYERDILYPLAAQRIEIDLDDGVKVNYAKFGKALAKVHGLNS